MMSLCKTVHSLLGFADPDDRCRGIPRRRRCIPWPYSDAAGLRCVAVEIPGPSAHVVESAAVALRPLGHISSPSPPPQPKHEKQQQQQQPQQQVVERIDDGTRGLSYLYGGGGGGGGGRLELCTESLGFESCCDGMMGAEEERAEQEIRRRIEEANRRSPREHRGEGVPRKKARPTRRTAEAREFPPPLTWLRGGDGRGGFGGRCRSFLKAVRKDGRFLLTEVRIEAPEVLRASREGGRLRLELVKSEPKTEEEVISELEEAVAEEPLGVEERAEEPLGVEEREEAIAEKAATAAEEKERGEEAAAAEEEEEPPWRLPAAALDRRSEGGRFRSGRCQELAMERLPASSSFWGSRFVTTA